MLSTVNTALQVHQKVGAKSLVIPYLSAMSLDFPSHGVAKQKAKLAKTPKSGACCSQGEDGMVKLDECRCFAGQLGDRNSVSKACTAATSHEFAHTLSPLALRRL